MALIRFGRGEMLAGTALAAPSGAYNYYLQAVSLADATGADVGTAGNPLVVTGSASGSNQVVGNVASGAADSGNPVKIGGVFNTAAPTLTNGQRGDLQLWSDGIPRSRIFASAQTASDGQSNGTAAFQLAFNGSALLPMVGGFNFNRTTGSWDRVTGTLTPVVGSAVTSLVVKGSAGSFVSGAMTAGATAGFFILYNAASAPAGGAALTAAQILACVPVAANGYATIGDSIVADGCTTGAVLLFSTSTTTYTVPANAALHMRGRAY